MRLYKKCLQTEKTLSSAGRCSYKTLISVAQFPDLVLDQPSGSTGQLIHAADACHIFAVDLCSGTGRAILAHEHGRHPDAHALQRTHLRGSVGHTGGVLVTAAQRFFRAGRDAAAVVGRSIRQYDEQMPRRRAGRKL